MDSDILPLGGEVKPDRQNDNYAASKEGAATDAELSSFGILKGAEISSSGIAEGAVIEMKPELEAWNNPRINTWRFLVSLYCLFMLGANDASIGALIPYLETYYSINYTVVATMFLSQVAGYTVSALVINKIHHSFGQLGIALAGPLCKIVSYVVMCVHPPFPAIPIVYAVAGFGNGLEDGAWNAWVGGLENANELLGLLHGTYGLGATIAPLVSTAMITKGHLQWYTFFYILLALAALELLFSLLAFRTATAAVFRESHPPPTTHQRSPTREAFTHRVTWVIALLLFFCVGVEVSVGGWVVVFMQTVRGGEPFASGTAATGFWLGLTVGRVVLGFVTGRVGEKLAVAGYVVLAIVSELLFWLVPSFVSSAICVAWLGFFIGPLFPGAVVVVTKVLPVRLHVSAIGFVAAIGSSGSAVMPFITGAVAQHKGVQVLEPIALALLVAILVLWSLLPGGFKKNGLDRMGEENTEASHGIERKIERRTEV